MCDFGDILNFLTDFLYSSFSLKWFIAFDLWLLSFESFKSHTGTSTGVLNFLLHTLSKIPPKIGSLSSIRSVSWGKISWIFRWIQNTVTWIFLKIMRFWWPYRTLGFVVGTTDDTKIDSVSKNVFYQSFRSGICKSRKGYVRKLQFSSIFNLKMPFSRIFELLGYDLGYHGWHRCFNWINQVFKNIKVFYRKPISL